ncbi:MAG TPA: sigma factor-like helix-turn-helix DNA-binding protein [Bryobacteraceae bacterium]|nr:sigma factor-like helix-turn-helix DNA-binding protein [Bryobacteraceae bacterium]
METLHGVMQFLYRMTQDRAIAERLTFEVAERAGKTLLARKPGRRMTIELYRIAYNVLRGTATSVNGQPVGRIMATLEERDRAAIVLHKYHHFECDEIAEILGCSATAAAQRLMRVYQVLAATQLSAAAAG